jgi:hypothetical protein
VAGALNPNQFFHGSRADLQPGDQLRPGNEIGRTNYDYEVMGRDRPNWVYMTGEHMGDGKYDPEDDAWMWSDRGSTPGRPTVYKVTPHDTPHNDPLISHHYRTSGATVEDRIDIAKPYLGPRTDEPMPVQGTLPPVDWRQYGLETNNPLLHEVVNKDRNIDARLASKRRREEAGHDGPLGQPYRVPGQERLL